MCTGLGHILLTFDFDQSINQRKESSSSIPECLRHVYIGPYILYWYKNHTSPPSKIIFFTSPTKRQDLLSRAPFRDLFFTFFAFFVPLTSIYRFSVVFGLFSFSLHFLVFLIPLSLFSPQMTSADIFPSHESRGIFQCIHPWMFEEPNLANIYYTYVYVP
jgi:hypothetical protein